MGVALMGFTCEKTVWRKTDSWRPTRLLPCGKPAKFEEEGKHYCGIHNPAREREKQARRERMWKEEARQRALVHAAPEMYALLKESQNHIVGIAWRERRDAVLAKAEGKVL